MSTRGLAHRCTKRLTRPSLDALHCCAAGCHGSRCPVRTMMKCARRRWLAAWQNLRPCGNSSSSNCKPPCMRLLQDARWALVVPCLAAACRVAMEVALEVVVPSSVPHTVTPCHVVMAVARARGLAAAPPSVLPRRRRRVGDMHRNASVRGWVPTRLVARLVARQ